MTDWLFNDSLYTGCPRSGFYNSSHRRSRHLESIQNIFCLDATKWLQQQKFQLHPNLKNTKVFLENTAILRMGILTTSHGTSAEHAQGTNRSTGRGTGKGTSTALAVIAAALLPGVLLAVPSMLALMDQFRPYSVNAALLLLSLTIIISGFATQYRSSSAHYPPGAFSPAGLLHQRDTRHNDELARQVSWSVMQPHITNESRNCGICRRADQTRLIFAPDLSLHYAAIIIAMFVIGWVVSISWPGSLPTFHTSESMAVADPGLKTFIYMFSGVVLFYIALLIRKPVRSLVFNKDPGIFWIEQKRVFGWKAAESAQMPLAQISALQIIRYGRHGVYQPNSAPISDSQNTQPDSVDIGNNQSRIRQTRKQHGYSNYEVNVVFCNAERVNIINHRSGTAIRQDAEALAVFLGVPVWDRAPAQ